MDFILGIGLSLPILTSVSIAAVTGIGQGVSQQQKANEAMAGDAADDTRMLKFHLDVYVEPESRKGGGAELNGGIVTLHDDKVWVDDKNPTTQMPRNTTHHAFKGFYIAYPDEDRTYTRGLVSTISIDPPMLNWLYVDKDTFEVKYSNRSGSIAHHVGSYDWTSDSNEDSSVTFNEWEGFLAVEEEDGAWALYFDMDDDGLKAMAKGKNTVEVSLVRRVIEDQETNKWGVGQSGNIGFKATKEELKCWGCKKMTTEKLIKDLCPECRAQG